MEDLQIFIMMIVVALIIKAAIKVNEANNEGRYLVWFSKTIYNYAGKSQEQIYAILALELEQLNFDEYEISHFSKPLFKKDTSAEYIVYLKRKEDVCE